MAAIKMRMGFVGVFVFSILLIFVSCERNITRVVNSSSPFNCFECHNDYDTKLVSAEGQWMNSRHASAENLDRSGTPCSGCHTSEGFVQRIDTGSAQSIDNPTAIHCFTCHAPHTNGDLSLRVTKAQALENGTSFNLGDANICVACHHARKNVDTYVYDGVKFTSTHWGPHHSVQGDMVIGSNTYEYGGYSYIKTDPHKSATQDGCLDCHFRTTRNYILGGHSFNMAYGDPLNEEINTAGCNVDGCHEGAVKDFNVPLESGTGIQDSVTVLLDSLEVLLVSGNLIDAANHHPIKNRVVSAADSAGAVWNYLLIEEDRSMGVHNPKYMLGLLNSSILYLTGGLPSAPALSSYLTRK